MPSSPLSFPFPGWTTDVRTLDLPPIPEDLCAPLPALWEPEVFPWVPPEAEGDFERLVKLEHRNIRVLSVYFHAGAVNARVGAWLRSGVAELLYTAAECLPAGFGLAVLDAYRPLVLQRELYDVAYGHSGLPPGFVSIPTPDISAPPAHVTGGAVDVTLTYRGCPLGLGTSFDDFRPEAAANAFEGVPGVVRDYRRMLFEVMRAQGFRVLEREWWHFEFGTPRWAALRGEEPRYRGLPQFPA